MQRFNKLFGAGAVLTVLVAQLGLVLPSAQAADTSGSGSANPRKIFVESAKLNQAWPIKLDVDSSDHSYRIGDKMQVHVTSDRAGYLYVFNQDPNGEIECIFPNNFQQDNQIAAGKEIVIGNSDKFLLRVGDPAGKELIIAAVTTQPLKSAPKEDLVEAKKAAPRKISYKQAKKIFVEALTGDPKLGDSQETPDKLKDKFQQDNPGQYKQQQQEYSMVQLEINTYVGKGSGSQNQDQSSGSGKDKGSGSQNQDQSSGSGKDKPTPDSKTKDKPNQDGKTNVPTKK